MKTQETDNYIHQNSIINNYVIRIEQSIAKRGTACDTEDIPSILREFQKDINRNIMKKIYNLLGCSLRKTTNAYMSNELRARVYAYGTDTEVYCWLTGELEGVLKETKKLAAEYNICLEGENYENT